jgi:hypothetical protein
MIATRRPPASIYTWRIAKASPLDSIYTWKIDTVRPSEFIYARKFATARLPNFYFSKGLQQSNVILIIRGEYQQGDQLTLLSRIPLTIVLVLVRAYTHWKARDFNAQGRHASALLESKKKVYFSLQES